MSHVMIRVDVARLLIAGHSDIAISRKLKADANVIARTRAQLGLPKVKPGNRPAASPEELFWHRVQPTPDGHMDWTGFRASNGTLGLRHNGTFHTAYRIAYRIANNREPQGKAQPNCTHDHCVKPGHHDDRIDRDARHAHALALARSAPVTLEEQFQVYAIPTADGHMDWTGPRCKGLPVAHHDGRQESVYRIAFRTAHGREPDGHVRPICGHDDCVKPGHHADHTIRQQEPRVDTLYDAIFGTISP
ncbi:hypothetical protein ACFUEN_29095 [Streptomyces griseorubiginosus]|uniref:hypothetical protein n=1 Tax=Streptomyces griseorubiginosus TaxID=67304 RepID=UPI0036390A01